MKFLMANTRETRTFSSTMSKNDTNDPLKSQKLTPKRRIIEIILLIMLTPLVIGAIVWAYFDMLIGHSFGLIGFLLLPIPLAIISIITFVFLIFRQFKPRLLTIIWLAGIVLPPVGFFSQVNRNIYFYWHQSELNTFVGDILSDRQIYEMSDCLRFSKSVNEYYVAGGDSTYYEYFVSSLTKDGISKERFDRYLDYLRDTKLISFEFENNYIIFCHDGFLSDAVGFLYVIDGEPPNSGDLVLWGNFKYLDPMGGNWYFYSMT